VDQDGRQGDLLRRAAEALARQDPRGALKLIDKADAFGPTHSGTLNRALALRLMGDFTASLAVLDAAMAMQPWDFAILLTGDGQAREARTGAGPDRRLEPELSLLDG
jgi:hypothetical protein